YLLVFDTQSDNLLVWYWGNKFSLRQYRLMCRQSLLRLSWFTSNLNRLIAFAVHDRVHHLNRSLVNTTNEIFECTCRLPRNKLYTFTVLICQKYIMSAVYIPETHVRGFIAVFFIYSGNIVVEVLTVLLACAVINLHIRNDN